MPYPLFSCGGSRVIIIFFCINQVRSAFCVLKFVVMASCQMLPFNLVILSHGRRKRFKFYAKNMAGFLINKISLLYSLKKKKAINKKNKIFFYSILFFFF